MTPAAEAGSSSSSDASEPAAQQQQCAAATADRQCAGDSAEHWRLLAAGVIRAAAAAMPTAVQEAGQDWWSSLVESVDLEYLRWLGWLLLPFAIAVLVPCFMCLMVYASAIFLHCYKLRATLRRAYAASFWDGARSTLAAFWDATGWLWHGYEVQGLENIPRDGPALIIFYHGPVPLDCYYLLSKLLLHKKRDDMRLVGDRFIAKIPGMKLLCDVFHITPGSVDTCCAVLAKGHLLAISPGGVREALFSDPRSYNLMWAQRKGFARIALLSRAPIIPMFTMNVRESMRLPALLRPPLRRLYECTRLPLVIYYGGLPVKLVTHIGKPIVLTDDQYETMTPSDMVDMIQIRLEAMIERHQRLPGSLLHGMLDRCRRPRRFDRPPPPAAGCMAGDADEESDDETCSCCGERDTTRCAPDDDEDSAVPAGAGAAAAGDGGAQRLAHGSSTDVELDSVPATGHGDDDDVRRPLRRAPLAATESLEETAAAAAAGTATTTTAAMVHV